MRHLLTGAGSGIGAALATLLAARGDELWLVARNATRAGELAERFPEAQVLQSDLAEELDLSAWPLPERLDSLVHSAGVVELGPVSGLTAKSLQHQFMVNAAAPALVTAWALPALRSAQGTVVFVNSGAGLQAHAEWSAYAASKFAVRAIADSLRAEESAAGVRVTTIYPGRTATPMQQAVKAYEEAPYDERVLIDPTTVAAQILGVIDLPVDAAIPDLAVRPSGRGPARPGSASG